MQHTTYLRENIYILILFGFIFFNGASCLKITQKAWPGINDSSGSSESEDTISYQENNLFDLQQFFDIADETKTYEKKWRHTTCYEKDQLWVSRLKDRLLYALDKTECTHEEKTSIENVILNFKDDHLSALQGSCITDKEIIDVIVAQLNVDKRQNKRLEQKTSTQQLENECPICLEDLEDPTYGEKLTSCKFKHTFHYGCIKKWVNIQGPNLCIWVRKILFKFNKLRCPMCNTEFDPNDFNLVSRHASEDSILETLFSRF